MEGDRPTRSNNPALTFGKTSSGNVNDSKTNLEAARQPEQITGLFGEGPSEFETLTAPEAQEQARRSVQEIYGKYKKLSEEVLEREAIPLGHRETIRRYFELIRPTEDQ